MTRYRFAAVAALVLATTGCQQGRADDPPAAQAVASVAQPVAATQPATNIVNEAADLAAYTGPAASDTMVIYKTPTCGCCAKWVDHVKENGFAVVVHDLDHLRDIKRELGVSPGHESCHTAVVRGYTVEGHVPADLIQRMIAEKPRFRGLAVPGMPSGSPGMEGLVKQAYKVIAFDSTGAGTVYAER